MPSPRAENGPVAEARLAIRAQLGDREALDELLARTQRWLYPYLARLVGAGRDAEDALQDALFLVCRKLVLLSEPRHYRAWVYRVATREALRGLRRRRDARSLDDVDADELPSAEPPERLDPDLVARLADEVGALPPNCRAVVLLHYVEGMKLTEVADVLDAPLGTVKSRLGYGLARLREVLAGIQR